MQSEASSEVLPAESRRGRPAAVLIGLEGLALIGFALLLVSDVIRGQADGTSQALAEAVLVLIFAAAAGWLAYGLWHGLRWARTPTLLWHVFLLPIGFSMLGADATIWGIGTLALAAAGLILGWRSPIGDFEDD
ncbi:hypothetical protein ACMYYO_11175 [Dermacoccaceae bacterium W4C1]